MTAAHLDDIATACGTDKSPAYHNYSSFYHQLFSPLRHKPVNMLEIGVLGGNSLCMWEMFFDHPDTMIWGIDIHDKWKPSPKSRIQVRIGSQDDPRFLDSLVAEAGMFDIIIDDGSHYSVHQKASLNILWPSLKSGGIWITEDTHTSWTYPWTNITDGEVPFVHSLGPWIDKLNDFGGDHCAAHTKSEIESIEFRKSLVILRKR